MHTVPIRIPCANLHTVHALILHTYVCGEYASNYERVHAVHLIQCVAVVDFVFSIDLDQVPDKMATYPYPDLWTRKMLKVFGFLDEAGQGELLDR